VPQVAGHNQFAETPSRWREVVRPDATIRYLDSGGNESPIVLIHGLAGHAGEWSATIHHLTPFYRCLALDQRGHGRSTRRPDDLSRLAFVDDVVAVIDGAGIEQPVMLIGQSMGAHTAFLAAARYPERVSHLIMIEGDVGGGADELATLRAALQSIPVPFSNYEQAASYFGGDTERGRAWADGLQSREDGLWPRWDLDVMLRAMEPIFEREAWQEWEDVTQPTLLVLGESGTIDPARIERMVAMRPQTRLVTIGGAGHDVHLDQPQEWLKTLDTFLDSRCLTCSSGTRSEPRIPH
jgi:pimeloyl-ACP methyl ester carboxylesterase